MSSPDEYGMKRGLLSRNGKAQRAPELIEGDVAGNEARARDLDEARERQLQKVEGAVTRILGMTRLQEIAGLLVELPYGDFIEMTEGIKSMGSEDLARLIHTWAKAHARTD